MMGLYECRARRYAVGVLRRRRGRCVPLPLTGVVNATSSEEELWTPSHVHVVVACECSARRAAGVFQRAASRRPRDALTSRPIYFRCLFRPAPPIESTAPADQSRAGRNRET